MPLKEVELAQMEREIGEEHGEETMRRLHDAGERLGEAIVHSLGNPSPELRRLPHATRLRSTVLIALVSARQRVLDESPDAAWEIWRIINGLEPRPYVDTRRAQRKAAD